MNFFIPNVFIHSIAKTFEFRLGIYYKNRIITTLKNNKNGRR